MVRRRGNGEPALSRELDTWDAALLTIGATLGTGIFLTTGDIARVLPHAGLILLVWIAGGLLTLAGALSYAELGAMFPRAGGQYHYLKEAYGPLWGFLFGWTAFFVVNTGGTAALAVGFGEYLGAFWPFFSTSHVLWAIPFGSVTWTVSGGQVAGVAVIVLLSAVNYFGVKQGAGVQNLVTVVKIGSLVALAALGLVAPAAVAPQVTASLPAGNVLVAFGVGMIGVLWAFDGWYGATASAGEMRTPERSLPLGLIIGTLTVTLLYTLMNVVYVRTLPTQAMAGTGRIAEAAALVLFGAVGARIVSAAVLISIFGCLAATILWTPRVYLPMAQDGVFFPVLARIHPRYRTPAACVAAQGIWSGILTLSGSFEQLYTYAIFAATAFHAATGLAVFVLRRTRPDELRPYRTWGYPWVPAAFILSCALIVGNTLWSKPVESFIGVGLVMLGLPAFWWWRRAGSQPRS